MRPPVIFDPSDHSYRVAGRVLPSVTQVLRAADGGDNWTPGPYYADLGTRVHHATAELDRNDSPLAIDHIPVVVDWDVEPFLNTYRRFTAQMRPAWTLIEVPTYHPTLDYAGTPDRIGFFNGSPVVFDIKTGIPTPLDPIQLAAYDMLCPTTPKGFRRTRIVLYLGATDFSLRTYSNPADYNTFLILLNRYEENARGRHDAASDRRADRT